MVKRSSLSKDYKNIVPLNGLKLKSVDPMQGFIAAMAIYSMIIPLVFLDIFTIMYQHVYFYIMGIPYVDRSKYIEVDRYKLNRLSFLQKVNCVYCGYANGLLAWVKAVANQTERYSCAIKHNKMPADHEHQKDFYDYNEWQ